jgi:hypothetical protein
MDGAVEIWRCWLGWLIGWLVRWLEVGGVVGWRVGRCHVPSFVLYPMLPYSTPSPFVSFRSVSSP